MAWKGCQSLEVLLPICLAFAGTVGEIGSELYETSAGVVALFFIQNPSYIETFPVGVRSGAQQEE